MSPRPNLKRERRYLWSRRQQPAEIRHVRVGDVTVSRVEILGRHQAGLVGNGGEIDDLEPGLAVGELQRHRAAVLFAPGDREGADVKGFPAVELADRTVKAARQIAEGVDPGAHLGELPLDPLLQGQAEISAGKLEVAVGVALPATWRDQVFGQRAAGFGGDSFRHGDHTAAVARDGSIDVGKQLVERERNLGHINQMRAVTRVMPPSGGRGGEEPGVAAHDDADIDARQRAKVEIDAEEGLGHEPRCRNEARRVVVFGEVVVDGLGRVDEGDSAVGLPVEDLQRAGGVVATDVDERVGAGTAQALENACAVGGIRLVAGRAQRRARRGGDGAKIAFGDRAEIDEISSGDAAHAMSGAKHPRARVAAARFDDRAGQGLIDDSRRAAALGDNENLAHPRSFRWRCQQFKKTGGWKVNEENIGQIRWRGQDPRSACKLRLPVPLHTVRIRFLGNIATPRLEVSPIRVIETLRDGELPEFDDVEAANKLLQGLLLLWNHLTKHQSRSRPFRLSRFSIGSTADDLRRLCQTRGEEIEGFIDGMLGDEEGLDLPQRAVEGMDQLDVVYARIGALIDLLQQEAVQSLLGEHLATSFSNVKELTRIAEKEIHAVILSCKRSRAQSIARSGRAGPTVH